MLTKNVRIMLAIFILGASFVMFACDDVEVGGEEIWDAQSPAGKAVTGAEKAFNQAGDAVSDFAHDAAGNVLDTELYGDTTLCDGLKCK